MAGRRAVFVLPRPPVPVEFALHRVGRQAIEVALAVRDDAADEAIDRQPRLGERDADRQDDADFQCDEIPLQRQAGHGAGVNGDDRRGEPGADQAAIADADAAGALDHPGQVDRRRKAAEFDAQAVAGEAGAQRAAGNLDDAEVERELEVEFDPGAARSRPGAGDADQFPQWPVDHPLAGVLDIETGVFIDDAKGIEARFGAVDFDADVAIANLQRLFGDDMDTELVEIETDRRGIVAKQPQARACDRRDRALPPFDLEAMEDDLAILAINRCKADRRDQRRDAGHAARDIAGADAGEQRRAEREGRGDGVHRRGIAAQLGEAIWVAGGIQRQAELRRGGARIIGPAADEGEHLMAGDLLRLGGGRRHVAGAARHRDRAALPGDGQFGLRRDGVGQFGDGRTVPAHHQPDPIGGGDIAWRQCHRRWRQAAGDQTAPQVGGGLAGVIGWRRRIGDRRAIDGIDIDTAVAWPVVRFRVIIVRKAASGGDLEQPAVIVGAGIGIGAGLGLFVDRQRGIDATGIGRALAPLVALTALQRRHCAKQRLARRAAQRRQGLVAAVRSDVAGAPDDQILGRRIPFRRPFGELCTRFGVAGNIFDRRSADGIGTPSGRCYSVEYHQHLDMARRQYKVVGRWIGGAATATPIGGDAGEIPGRHRHDAGGQRGIFGGRIHGAAGVERRQPIGAFDGANADWRRNVEQAGAGPDQQRTIGEHFDPDPLRRPVGLGDRQEINPRCLRDDRGEAGAVRRLCRYTVAELPLEAGVGGRIEGIGNARQDRLPARHAKHAASHMAAGGDGDRRQCRSDLRDKLDGDFGRQREVAGIAFDPRDPQRLAGCDGELPAGRIDDEGAVGQRPAIAAALGAMRRHHRPGAGETRQLDRVAARLGTGDRAAQRHVAGRIADHVLGDGDRRRVDRRGAEFDTHFTLQSERRTEQHVADPDAEIAHRRRIAREIQRGFLDRDATPFGALAARLDIGGGKGFAVVIKQLVDGQAIVGTAKKETRRLEGQPEQRAGGGAGIERVGRRDEADDRRAAAGRRGDAQCPGTDDLDLFAEQRIAGDRADQMRRGDIDAGDRIGRLQPRNGDGDAVEQQVELKTIGGRLDIADQRQSAARQLERYAGVEQRQFDRPVQRRGEERVAHRTDRAGIDECRIAGDDGEIADRELFELTANIVGNQRCRAGRQAQQIDDRDTPSRHETDVSPTG